MVKTIWIDAHHLHGHEHIVDGHRLASDTQDQLRELEASGYEILSVTPVISGRYNFQKFDGRKTPDFISKPTVSPDTCASWGYSMTDGFVVVARQRG